MVVEGDEEEEGDHSASATLSLLITPRKALSLNTD